MKSIGRNLGFEIIQKRTRNFDHIILEVIQISKIDPFLVFDVGGHRGESILRFQKLFPNSFTLSFEPNSDLKLDKHIQNLLDDTRFFQLPFAVSDKWGGSLSMKIHKTSTGSSSALNVKQSSKFALRRQLGNFANIEKRKILKVNIDTVFSRLQKNQAIYQFDFNQILEVEIKNKIKSKARNLSIDFLKIDVQGTEYDVLRGAKALLQNQKIKLNMTHLIKY